MQNFSVLFKRLVIFLGFFSNCKPLFGSEQIMLLLLLFFFFFYNDWIYYLHVKCGYTPWINSNLHSGVRGWPWVWLWSSKQWAFKIFALQTLSAWLRTENFCTHSCPCNPIWRPLMPSWLLFLLVCLHTLSMEIRICIKNLWDKFSCIRTEFEWPFFLSISWNVASRLKFIRVLLTLYGETCCLVLRNDSMSIKTCYCIVF